MILKARFMKYISKVNVIVICIGLILVCIIVFFVNQKENDNNPNIYSINADGVFIEGEELEGYTLDVRRYDSDSSVYKSIYNSLHSESEQVRALEVIDIILKDDDDQIYNTKKNVKVRVELKEDTKKTKGNYLLWDKNCITIPSSIFSNNYVTYETNKLGMIAISMIEKVNVSDVHIENEEKISIQSAIVSSLNDYKYTGKDIKPSLTLTLGEKKLKNGVDYTISYFNNKNVGDAKAIINGIGNYQGSITVTFKIVDNEIHNNNTTNIEIKKISIDKAKIMPVKNQEYTGKKIIPLITVTLDEQILKRDIDYTIVYSNNVHPGKALITIKGKGKYQGSITTSFTIVDRKKEEIKTIALNTVTTCHGFKGYYTKDRNELNLIFDKLGLANDNSTYSIMVTEYYDVDTKELIFFCIPEVIVPWKFDNKVEDAGGYESIAVKVN